MAEQTFARIEKKYLLSQQQYEAFLKGIDPYMQADSYGRHTICNVYYDTEQYDLIRNSLEKPKYKEKLRLRSYGIPKDDSTVFIEIKKKSLGVVYKRREMLTYQEAMDYLIRNIHPNKDTQIMREIDYFRKFYHPKAKVYLAYDRVAYAGREDSELRMTFDTRIRSREDDLFLSHGDRGKELLPQGTYLLEVKVPGAFPLWLAGLLSRQEIYPVSFSKYGEFYKEKIMKEGRKNELPVWERSGEYYREPVGARSFAM